MSQLTGLCALACLLRAAADEAADMHKPKPAAARVCVPDSKWESNFHNGCGVNCCAAFCNGSCVFPGPHGNRTAGKVERLLMTRLTPYEVADPVRRHSPSARKPRARAG